LDYRREVLKKPLGRKVGTKLKKTAKLVEAAKKHRAEGQSYGKIALAMNVSRQRACQLCAM